MLPMSMRNVSELAAQVNCKVIMASMYALVDKKGIVLKLSPWEDGIREVLDDMVEHAQTLKGE